MFWEPWGYWIKMELRMIETSQVWRNRQGQINQLIYTLKLILASLRRLRLKNKIIAENIKQTIKLLV